MLGDSQSWVIGRRRKSSNLIAQLRSRDDRDDAGMWRAAAASMLLILHEHRASKNGDMSISGSSHRQRIDRVRESEPDLRAA